MKKQDFILLVLMISVSVGFTSCTDKGKKGEIPAVEVVKDQYQCPMKCNGELYDKPGKCHVCEMELEKVTKS